MSVTVHAARCGGDALATLLDGLWPETIDSAILKREDAIQVVRHPASPPSWSSPRGRAFGRHAEVRWEQGGMVFHVVLIRDDGAAAPPSFERALTLDETSVTAEQEWYYLWGEDDLAIGGRLKYGDAIPDAGRAQIGVVRYVDRAGHLILYRYVEMRREPAHAGQAAY